MPITVSGLFVQTFMDVFDTTQLAIDFDLETHRVALFTNATANPNFSTDTAYGVAPYNANEATGVGYTAGGNLLTSTALTESPAGSLMWDAADVSWPTSSVTARGALIYADALAGNNAIMLVNFGADYTSTGGTFLIQWAPTGLLAWDLTP